MEFPEVSKNCFVVLFYEIISIGVDSCNKTYVIIFFAVDETIIHGHLLT